jgi:hypothetical protein
VVEIAGFDVAVLGVVVPPVVRDVFGIDVVGRGSVVTGRPAAAVPVRFALVAVLLVLAAG